MKISEDVRDLSNDLAILSIRHSQSYLPIDRFFIEEYNFLEEIKKVDSLEFLFCNLERINTTYTVQMMLCIPELWEDVGYEELVQLIESFTNSFSFYALVEFTYKYLEIDLLNEIFDNPNVKQKFKDDCLEYFPRIVATFYLEEDESYIFDENLMGIQLSDWSYIKQRLLVDKRIKPALEPKELFDRLKKFNKID